MINSGVGTAVVVGIVHIDACVICVPIGLNHVILWALNEKVMQNQLKTEITNY